MKINNWNASSSSPQYLSVCDFLTTQSLKFLLSNYQNRGFAPYVGAQPNAMTTAEVISTILETGVLFPSNFIESEIKRLIEWQHKNGSWTDPNSQEHQQRVVSRRDASDRRT